MADELLRPGLEGVVAAETRVSDLDPEHELIIVRGHDLIELARNASYLHVAYLLLYGSLPDRATVQRFEADLVRETELPEAAYRLFEILPPDTSVMDAVRTACSFLAGFESPEALAATDEESNRLKGLKMLAKAPTAATNAYRALRGQPFLRPDPGLGYVRNFIRMSRGSLPDEPEEATFDAILTCYSEHEMPNSTFAARVIASTFSDAYGAITGAAASLKGPLHGGANEAAIRMLLDIQRGAGVDGAESYVLERLRRREKIMGFGHRVYMTRHDPRALFLQKFIPKLAARRPEGPALYEIYQRVERVVAEEKGIYPNADYPIGLLLYLMDIPIDLYTPIFLCARLPGLIAHVIEQHANNRIFRPRARYTGPRPGAA